eukprot:gene8647-8828_t
MVDMYASVDDRIVFYKTLNCHKMFVHDWSACPYKHKGEKARRRCLLEYTYSGKICPEMKEMFEYWMHPQKYRTTMCKDAPGCKRPFCFFAHNDQELRDPEDLPALLKEPTTTLPPETLSNLPPGTLTGSGNGLSTAAIAAGQALPGALATIAARAAVSPARTPRSASPSAAGAAQPAATPVAVMNNQSLVQSSAPFLLRSISLPQAAAITAPPSPAEVAPAAGLLPNALAAVPAQANAAMALGGCMAASLASYPGVKAPEPRLFELF